MEEKTLKEATVVFPVRDGKVVLGVKTRKIGMGCRNGYGGGVEEGDASIEAAALRELEQESGLVGAVADLDKVAVCHFTNTKSDGTTMVATVHIYILRAWTGEPRATEEMADPRWFSVDSLPLDAMMPADKDWVPRVLAGERLIVRASYGPFQKELLSPVTIAAVSKEML